MESFSTDWNLYLGGSWEEKVRDENIQGMSGDAHNDRFQSPATHELAHSHVERDNPVWGPLHRTIDKTETHDRGGLEVWKALLVVRMRRVAGEGSEFRCVKEDWADGDRGRDVAFCVYVGDCVVREGRVSRGTVNAHSGGH